MKLIHILIASAIGAGTAMAQGGGFFAKDNPASRNDDTGTCHIELRYSSTDPSAVTVDVSARNPVSRCNDFMDRVAVAAANMRLVVERQ